MSGHDRKRMVIEGKFILHLRIQGTDLLVSDIREMTGHHKTIARLRKAGVTTISEVCALDYERLRKIVGDRRADFMVHLLGLYGLKTVPSRVVTADVTTPMT